MELNLFIISFTIVFALLNIANTSARKIVGGVDAGPEEFPYEIALRFVVDDSYGFCACGGSILTENWILTAAHCKICELLGILEAVAGEVDLNNLVNDTPNKQVRTITEVIAHEKFAMGVLGPYNIAIGKLNSPFVLNEFVNVINLPVENNVPTGSAIISGWGSVSNSTEAPTNILQKAEVPIIDLNQCKELYNDIDFINLEDSNVCAGELSGERLACSGDLGGPLVQIDKEIVTQVGIVSVAPTPCGKENRPVIFTKVSFYVDWINTKINS